MIDSHLPLDLRNIGDTYSCYVILAVTVFLVGICFQLVCMYVLFYNLMVRYFKNNFWWLFIFPPIAFALMLIAVGAFLKNVEDKKTLRRHIEMYTALKRCEAQFLDGTGITLYPGAYSAWLEVVVDNPYGKNLEKRKKFNFLKIEKCENLTQKLEG